MFAGRLSQIGVAGAAEGVEGRFRCLGEVRGLVAVEATADTRFVNEVVMTSDAVDGGVLFVGKVHR